MLTIHLKDLSFFSFHGLFPQEKVLGNRFTVNVSIGLFDGGPVADLSDTIDYTTAYQVIKQRMDEPAGLLEAVAQDIALLLKKAEDKVRSVEISIFKDNPPVANAEGRFGVSYKIEF